MKSTLLISLVLIVTIGCNQPKESIDNNSFTGLWKMHTIEQLDSLSGEWIEFPWMKGGVPALRYQGRLTLVAETEQLFNFAKRWDAVAFTGIGAAFKSLDDPVNEDIVWNVGVGARFLTSESLGVKIGADIARGPEDYAFYISIGSAW